MGPQNTQTLQTLQTSRAPCNPPCAGEDRFSPSALRTQLLQKGLILFAMRGEVLLGKLQSILCLALPDQLYQALLLEVKGQLVVFFQNLQMW